MPSRKSITLPVALSAGLLLVACRPVQPTPSPAPAGASPMPPPATVVLPDGLECRWAGDGATLAFDGERLNYTCTAPSAEPGAHTDGDTIGLIGDFIPGFENVWTVEEAVIGRDDTGYVLKSTTPVTFRTDQATLTNGTTCLWAGGGATLAFDGKRVNYTCGKEGEDTIGLLGLVAPMGMGIWSAERASIGHGSEGFTLNSSLVMPVMTVVGVAADATDTGELAPPADPGTVDVTVTYRQRIALPPGATVQVQLVDVSLQDAPAQVLDEEVLITDGAQQVPLNFTLTYDPAEILASRTYAVQARIEFGGGLKFINTTRTEVINNGVTEVELMLDLVG